MHELKLNQINLYDETFMIQADSKCKCQGQLDTKQF
jgi:hypothetical protein